jgi:hypothetical protein
MNGLVIYIKYDAGHAREGYLRRNKQTERKFMKTLLTLSAMLLSANAFAFDAETLVKALNYPTVKETIGRRQIETIAHGISYRCMGCYGIDITLNDGEAYRVHTKDFAGRFEANIVKIEE